jgi:hypothetical protein
LLKPIGKERRDGYIPTASHGPEPEVRSHETTCILNAGDQDAHVRITVPARRTKHVCFNELQQPQSIQRGTDFSSSIESDVPVVVQHTRLDSRRDALALLSTIAYAGSDRTLAADQ